MEGEELANDPVRMILRARGYRFCDDQRTANTSEVRELTQRSRDEADILEELLEEGLVASSTDHETQGIGNTLDSTPEFWSSRGSETTEASEDLTFRLRYPACVVRYLEVSVYRAHYQFGQPLYPPQTVAVDIGPTQCSLHRVSSNFPVRAVDTPQLFMLPFTAAIGGYLRVHMEGKPQMQLADGRYYIAIQHVKALGLPVPEHSLNRISLLLRSNRFALHSGSYFPSTSLSYTTPPGCKTVLQRIAHRRRLRDAEAERPTGPNGDENISQGRKLDRVPQVPGFQRLFRIFHRFPGAPVALAQEQRVLCRASSDGAAQVVQKLGWQLPLALFTEEPVREAWDVHHFPEQWRGLQDIST